MEQTIKLSSLIDILVEIEIQFLYTQKEKKRKPGSICKNYYKSLIYNYGNMLASIIYCVFIHVLLKLTEST